MILRNLLVILSCLFFAFGCQKKEAALDAKPNVLMIVVDDMNGYSIREEYPLVQTPYLDKLKGQSINFVNAACNTPVCNPSRSSFFSGIFPHKTGAYVNGSDGWNRSEILSSIRSIPEHFRDNGYETWGAGKIFHNKLDSARESGMWDNYPVFKGGFGPFPEKKFWLGGSRFSSIKQWTDADTDFPDVKNANAAIEFLSEDHEKPFFLYYGLWRPHSPYTAPKRFFDLYDSTAVTLPNGYNEDDLNDVGKLGRMLLDSLKSYRDTNDLSESKWRQFIYAYLANYSFADWNVGRVIEALDSSLYANNTIVVFFSDNGFHNGEKLRWGKATLWEQADYVPFMIRTPDKEAAISQATVSLVDVFPTIVDYCGLTSPNHELDGNSLVPLLENPLAEWDKPSFTSYGERYSSVRNERYRYLQYPDGSEELYDHKTDPYEWNSIANEPESRKIIDRLKPYIPNNWAPTLGGRLEVRQDFDEVMRPNMKTAKGPNGS